VVLGNQAYGPYGNTRYSKGSVGTQKGFTGQIADPISGLDDYGARYYDPVVGRFVSADSVQGNAQGMDPYAYVGGNPETLNDPTGNMFAPAFGASGGGGTSVNAGHRS
jgi:RHS repeat-associated protein